MSGHSEYDDDDTRKTPKSLEVSQVLTPDQIALRSQERRAQIMAVGLALETLLLVMVGIGVLLWYYQQQKARATEIANRAVEADREAVKTLNEARELTDQAKTLTENPHQWQAALKDATDAIKASESLLKNGEVKDEHKQNLESLRAELAESQKACKLALDLDEIRLAGTNAPNRYAARFKQDHDDLDVRLKIPTITVPRLQKLPNRDAVLDHLLQWASVTPDAAERRKLFEVVNATDPDANSLQRKIVKALRRRSQDADRFGERLRCRQSFAPHLVPAGQRPLPTRRREGSAGSASEGAGKLPPKLLADLRSGRLVAQAKFASRTGRSPPLSDRRGRAASTGRPAV
jgi:hypothetical protein